MALVIENGKVLQPDYTFKEQALAVDGNVITALGPRSRILRAKKRYDRLDASGCLVLPGLINAHTHAALGLAQGFGVGMPLFEMFEKVLFPLEKKMTDEHAYLGAMLSAMEWIHTGTTCVNNINARWPKQVLKAFEALGIRGTMAIALKDRTPKGEEFECRGLRESEWLVKRLEGHERLKGMYGIANEVEASDALITHAGRLAREHNTGLHIHVAETTSEKGFIMQRTGKTSVRYLYDLGALNEKGLAIHVVNITKNDIPILAKSRVSVVHCPTVNLNLGSGVSPVASLLEAGVAVGIGVDDPIANMSNDLRRELTNALILQQSIGHRLSPKSLLSMALNSRLYGYANGALRQGQLADIAVISMRDRAVPQDDDSLLQEALFADAPVVHSVINGEIVMRDSALVNLNERSILRKAQHACERLRG